MRLVKKGETTAQMIQISFTHVLSNLNERAGPKPT